MHDLDALNVLFGDAVQVSDGRLTVTRPEALATPKMDELAKTAVFGEPEAKEYARWMLWEIGQAVGVQPSSIHDLYKARGRKEVHGFTVPAINVRASSYETMRSIRNMDAFQTLPIIAITGKSTAGERERCSDAGANDYVPKPVDGAALLAAMVIIAVGFMVQDVVADALSVELATTEEEVKQIQTLGRMALLAGTISVGYLSGWLAGALGPRPVFAIALLLPALVMAAAWLIPPETLRVGTPGEEANPLGAGKSRLVVLVGLGYAALGVALEALSVPFGQEIILVVSGGLIVMLLQRVGISRAVAIAAFAIFCFRAVPSTGQGFSYWAIDRLGFDQEFLGVLAQVGAVLCSTAISLRPFASDAYLGKRYIVSKDIG